MPGEHLIPGFFGKLPAAGDFVSRGLPEGFVRRWDRFCARHLVQPLAEAEGGHTALRFLWSAAGDAPVAGVVVASSDRVGRRYPLTIAVLIPAPSTELPLLADQWFSDASGLAEAAGMGAVDADDLETRLAGMPFTAAGAGGEPIEGLVLWTDPYELHLVEPEAPEATLALLLQHSDRAA